PGRCTESPPEMGARAGIRCADRVPHSILTSRTPSALAGCVRRTLGRWCDRAKCLWLARPRTGRSGPRIGEHRLPGHLTFDTRAYESVNGTGFPTPVGVSRG